MGSERKAQEGREYSRPDLKTGNAMSKTTLYPNWKELAKIIRETESAYPASFYSEADLAAILDAEPGTPPFAYQWMTCRAQLLREEGIDFVRVKSPVRGYKAMTDSEKVNYGFTRRMNKTRRNAKRMAQVAGGVNRNMLSDNDARAHDANVARAGLLNAVFRQLPQGVKDLRLTVDIDREMPKLTS